MKQWLATAVLCLNSLLALSPEDTQTIRQVIADYTHSWNCNGCKGFSKNFSKDADFVNIFGMYFSGKQEIEDRHIEILSTFFKDSQLKVTQTNLREVNPDLVIAKVYWSLDGFRDPRSGPDGFLGTRRGIFTQVFIRTENGWEITASQNTVRGH